MLLLVVALVAGCREEPVQVLSEYESAELAARVNDFQVYPGARFLDRPTVLMRKAFFAMNPRAKRAPATAIYESDAPFEEIAAFYARENGWGGLAANVVNGFSVSPPHAYYRTGDLKSDAERLMPVLEKLDLHPDFGKISGSYRAAHVDANGNRPKVDLQTPWVDLTTGEVHQTTLIAMVKAN